MGNLVQSFYCCEASHDDTGELDYDKINKQKKTRRMFMRSITNVDEINRKYVQGRLLGQGGFGKVV